MSYNLFVDDERFPADSSSKEFVIVRSSKEAQELMLRNGCPNFISFDHDLGGDDTAMSIVHWMIDVDLNEQEREMEFIPESFTFEVHSQNPIGAKNIKETLNSYLKFRNS